MTELHVVVSAVLIFLFMAWKYPRYSEVSSAVTLDDCLNALSENEWRTVLDVYKTLKNNRDDVDYEHVKENLNFLYERKYIARIQSLVYDKIFVFKFKRITNSHSTSWSQPTSGRELEMEFELP